MSSPSFTVPAGHSHNRIAISFHLHSKTNMSQKKSTTLSSTSSQRSPPPRPYLEYEQFGGHKLIGQGWQGSVYEVHTPPHHNDADLQGVQKLAAKIVRVHGDFYPTREVAEIHHAANGSDFLPAFYRYYEREGCAIYLTELITGPPLLHFPNFLAVHGELYMLRVVSNVLEAVEFLHKKCIIHNDIKPDNIMFTKEPDSFGFPFVKLLDFGLSKKQDPYGDTWIMQGKKLAFGTPGYSAPELLTGETIRPGFCDMWSIGVLLYVLITNEQPYMGTFESVARQAQHSTPNFHHLNFALVHAEIKQLAMSLLRLNPTERPRATQAKDIVCRVLNRHYYKIPQPSGDVAMGQSS